MQDQCEALGDQNKVQIYCSIVIIHHFASKKVLLNNLKSFRKILHDIFWPSWPSSSVLSLKDSAAFSAVTIWLSSVPCASVTYSNILG